MNAAEHNHPPRCCCAFDPHADPAAMAPKGTLCPACVEHGELAPPIECPQCHQPIGRPHTEFCTLAPDRVWPDGHHLVHSEAFIDQDDPRSKATSPNPAQASLDERRQRYAVHCDECGANLDIQNHFIGCSQP